MSTAGCGSLTWLTAPSPDPLATYSPTICKCNPAIVQNIDTLVPTLAPPPVAITSADKDHFDDFSTQVYEWLSLVRLQSPRVQPRDQIDPYLCRYEVPGDEHTSTKLCKITWQGFLAPSWSRQMLIDIIGTLPAKTWFSFSTTTFSKGMAGDNTECTFLRPPGAPGEYMMWEIKSHE